MSKIDDLIKQYCPNGVEWKRLGDVCDITTGKLNANAAVVNGKYMFFTCDSEPSHIDKYAFDTDAILISGNGSQVGHLHSYCGKFNAYQRTYVLDNFDRLVMKAYLYNYMNGYLRPYIMSNCRKGSVPYITLPMLQSFQIPIPHIAVQDEIVRILDEYTNLEAELEAKLSEEIKLKQKQYEVYRARLLNDDSYDGYTLPEISENCDSQRKPITSSQRVSGSTPYYGASGIVDYVDDYIFDGEYLLISEDGANLLARSTPIAFSISGKTWVNNHAHILKFESYYTQKWVEYYFNSIDLSLYITGGAQPKLNQKNLNKIVIPVPSLTEQERIVKILDKYDTYTRDMISTLNTELESRKKQYAYYRDQLLTFKRKE